MSMNIDKFKGQFGSNPKEDVKQDILGWFKNNSSQAGAVLSGKNLLHLAINRKWNIKQSDATEEAKAELINEGLVENHKNGIALTDQGIDKIY